MTRQVQSIDNNEVTIEVAESGIVIDGMRVEVKKSTFAPAYAWPGQSIPADGEQWSMATEETCPAEVQDMIAKIIGRCTHDPLSSIVSDLRVKGLHYRW